MVTLGQRILEVLTADVVFQQLQPTESVHAQLHGPNSRPYDNAGGTMGKFLVLDSNLLLTGPYTTGVHNSRIGLVGFPYPRETSSKNSSAHRTGAGYAYGSPAASIYRIWRIANAAGYTLLATARVGHSWSAPEGLRVHHTEPSTTADVEYRTCKLRLHF